MTEEGEAQLGVVADAAEPSIGVVGGFVGGVGAQIGELLPLERSPDLFDRVEVVGVGGRGSTTSQWR